MSFVRAGVLLALSLVGAAACRETDPCPAAAAQSCIALRVVWTRNAPSRALEQVSVRAVEGFALDGRTPMEAGDEFSLPVVIPIVIGTFGGRFSLEVRGLRQGTVIGSGTISGMLSSGAHNRVDVELAPTVLDSDGGVPAGFEVTTIATTVEEHESFVVHIRARDADGATMRAYAGTPSLTADWGNLTVRTAPVFVDGEADATVSLNRETNPTMLAAHVRVSDGAMEGLSPGLVAVAPAWQQHPSPLFTTSPSGWDRSMIDSPTWTRQGGAYFLFYRGFTPTQASWGTAISDDGFVWMRQPQPNLVPPTTGWDANEDIVAWKATWDGARFVAVYAVPSGLGFATSPNGIEWARQVSPIGIEPTVECPDEPFVRALLVEPSSYRIYLEAPAGPCVIESSDGGLTWTKLIHTTGLPASMPIQVAAVVREGDVHRLWYAILDGGSTSGYATSTDGLSWITSPSTPADFLIETALWNEALERYEALYLQGGTEFWRAVRP